MLFKVEMCFVCLFISHSHTPTHTHTHLTSSLISCQYHHIFMMPKLGLKPALSAHIFVMNLAVYHGAEYRRIKRVNHWQGTGEQRGGSTHHTPYHTITYQHYNEIPKGAIQNEPSN